MKIPEYIVEPATLADVKQLVALEQNLFMTDDCSRKNLRYLIRHVTVIVARTEKSDEIAGYAILLNRKNSIKMRIHSFAVEASHRNRGVGSKLVGSLEAIANTANSTMITLEVSDTNKVAVIFYNKCGFNQYGFRFGYYQDGGHAILMRKILAAASIKNDQSTQVGY
jgi:[ribosomal protein S18]-alanine N-acetyltransferase